MKTHELLDDPELQFVDVYGSKGVLNYDCKNYALGHDLNTFPEGYIEVDVPGEGDIIVYYADEISVARAHAPVHYGVFVSDTNIRSKWGQCHVFEHRIEDVPHIYGTIARFFRKVAATM